jgi:predicted ATPase
MVPKLVLTGGPCAGKTSCLRALRERFGAQIITVPETATFVLGCGFPPPGNEQIPCTQDDWIRAFQGTILSIQQEVEASLERLARHSGARLIVCDRGVLDGAAYWPGGRESFMRHFGLSLEENFARYRAVLHLQSLAQSHPHLYGTESNATRYEGTADALRVERAVRAAWEGHPGLIVIPAEMELQERIARAIECVQSFL